MGEGASRTGVCPRRASGHADGVVAQTEYGPTMAVSTGHFTGRSPHDKYFVDQGPNSTSAQHIDWNAINQPTTPAVFATLHTKAVDYFNTLKEVYVLDCYVGASPTSRKKIRFVHEMAWQQVCRRVVE